MIMEGIDIQKTLEDIEYYSYRYLSKSEIAVITGVPLSLLDNVEHGIGKAFLKGRYMRKAEFHDSIIKLSKQLSSPAMQIEQKIAEQTFINDSKLR